MNKTIIIIIISTKFYRERNMEEGTSEEKKDTDKDPEGTKGGSQGRS